MLPLFLKNISNLLSCNPNISAKHQVNVKQTILQTYKNNVYPEVELREKILKNYGGVIFLKTICLEIIIS